MLTSTVSVSLVRVSGLTKIRPNSRAMTSANTVTPIGAWTPRRVQKFGVSIPTMTTLSKLIEQVTSVCRATNVLKLSNVLHRNSEMASGLVRTVSVSEYGNISIKYRCRF